MYVHPACGLNRWICAEKYSAETFCQSTTVHLTEMLKKTFLTVVLLLIGGNVYAQQLQQLGDENPTSKQQLCV